MSADKVTLNLDEGRTLTYGQDPFNYFWGDLRNAADQRISYVRNARTFLDLLDAMGYRQAGAGRIVRKDPS